MVLIGNSIAAYLRRYSIVWRKFILRYKTVNLGVGGERTKNFLWRIDDIVLPKSIRSVVIHHGTNNIGTRSSDEIILGVVTIARSIYHRYPNIEVIVSGLLPRGIHWSTRRVKLNKTNAYLRNYCKKSNKVTFMRQNPDWTLSDNSLNKERCYKDPLHLIENEKIKFSKLIIETYGYYSLPLKFSGKFVTVTFPLLFFSLILHILTRLFLSGANKKLFKNNKTVWRKCCQLKALEPLLMHLLVTLLINETTDSDYWHFLFNTLKNENKEEFLKGSTFLTFELTEKNILRKRLSQDALSRIHLNKYGSHLKFILLLLGDINLKPGPTTPKRNDILWEPLPFYNCSFSTEWMDYQLDCLSAVSNDAWNIFQIRGMGFIHLNINSLLSKIDEILKIAKLTNATVIGLHETKLENTERYCLIY